MGNQTSNEDRGVQRAAPEQPASSQVQPAQSSERKDPPMKRDEKEELLQRVLQAFASGKLIGLEFVFADTNRFGHFLELIPCFHALSLTAIQQPQQVRPFCQYLKPYYAKYAAAWKRYIWAEPQDLYLHFNTYHKTWLINTRYRDAVAITVPALSIQSWSCFQLYLVLEIVPLLQNLERQQEAEKALREVVQFAQTGTLDGLDRAEGIPEEVKKDAAGAPATMQCIICLDAPRTQVFLPCHHVCCCEPCSLQLTECPTCRQTIAERQRVYL